MTGTGAYLKEYNPNIVNVGAFTSPGDSVPGPRQLDLVVKIDFPWREVIDEAEHVSAFDSYRTSLELSRSGLLVGPSSGMSLAALYQYLHKLDDAGLDRLRDDNGIVNCPFSHCVSS